ncbi:DUF4177 domain-containing protein [Fluviibacterium sp. S390]|uniref:DUF4177 domain-containing protein n=1 Tax=Fluviibacterium sp. S390 TaxID=3415139 RepID=UPI003C7E567A
MSHFEYKVTPAPARGVKGKGGNDASSRFAATLSEALNQEARDGWDFLRAETLPVEERQGLTGTKTVFRSMLVFRRSVDMSEDEATKAALRLLEDRTDDRTEDRAEDRTDEG